MTPKKDRSQQVSAAAAAVRTAALSSLSSPCFFREYQTAAVCFFLFPARRFSVSTIPEKAMAK